MPECDAPKTDRGTPMRPTVFIHTNHKQMVGALVGGLDAWVLAEAENAALLRR